MSKNIINNNENMKMIRKRMIDLELSSIDELASYLYTSDTTLRNKLNGNIKIRKSDLEFMEGRLGIKFNWDLIEEIDGRWCLFYRRGDEEK